MTELSYYLTKTEITILVNSMADLILRSNMSAKVDFKCVSTYGRIDILSGKVTLSKKFKIDIQGREVFLYRDIGDTSNIWACLVDHLEFFNPSSIKICTTINKQKYQDVRLENKDKIDYTCHVASKGFSEGYGFGYTENYRNLPAVYHLNL